MRWTQAEFFAGLDRLGQRDARKLIHARAFDGAEAAWAAAWLRGEAPAPDPSRSMALSGERIPTDMPSAGAPGAFATRAA